MVKNMSSVELDGFSATDKFMVLSSGVNGFFSYDAYDNSVQIPGKSKKSFSTFENDLEKLSKKVKDFVSSRNDALFSERAISATTIYINSITPQSIVAGNKEVLTIRAGGLENLFQTPTTEKFHLKVLMTVVTLGLIV